MKASTPGIQFGQTIVRAAASTHDLRGLTQPLLEALAQVAGFESTYVMVFDWQGREQEVRFVHNTGDIPITEGQRIPLPNDVSAETLPGVTRSPFASAKTHPDSVVAQNLGLKSYASVPIRLAKHQLYGMLCGASREEREVAESVVSVMEFFAQIIADHVTRSEVAATEKRADAAEEKLRSRARFLAEAEHKLKTPLTALEGMSTLLLDRWENTKPKSRNQFLEVIVRNAQELRVMIDELLIEARSELQTRELTPSDIDLSQLANMISKAFGATSHSHDVVAEIPENLTVWADPAPLYQVLGHLLDNSIKYSPSGGEIKIRALESSPDVVIEVIDEGLGLPEDIDIFEPFRRGDPNDQSTAGIGLGLHIVQSLVEAMGGEVTARNNPKRGSTFAIRLPASSRS